METRARYFLIGLFLLAITAAGFGFVYWLNNSAGFGARTAYTVNFKGPAFGLGQGSSVLFNGIKVGEVTQLQLSPAFPGEVFAVIEIDVATPITVDTQVGLEALSLMGVPAISLIGGAPGAAPLVSTDGNPPVLVAPPEAGLDAMRAARQVLMRVDKLIAENSDPLRDMMANLRTFAAALGRNAGKVDTITEGLSGMFGGQQKPAAASFELSAAQDFPGLGAIPDVQLSVAEPSSVLTLDTQKIMSSVSGRTSAVFPEAQWSDNLPKLVQAKLVRSFENARFLGAEAGEDSFDADAKLVVDIRSFYVMPDSSEVVIECTAKVVSGGRVSDARTFRQARPADTANVDSVAAAFDDAFKAVASEMTVWTLGLL